MPEDLEMTHQLNDDDDPAHKEILAKQKAITTALTTESEQVNNDLLIAESRIKDLERQ
jgi:hypothetical protein